MAICKAARVVLIVSLLALKGPVDALGVAGVTAQEAPDLYTAETPLFHSSTSTDERVLLIGRLQGARLLSPDRFVFVDGSFHRIVFVGITDGRVIAAGREGEGPNEFSVPFLAGRSEDGGVVVWDPGHRRIALVNADGTFAEPPRDAPSQTHLHDRGELVGRVLRSRSAVKPLFVSVGHRITLEEAVAVVISCLDGYRIPRPLRLAHQRARAAAQGNG